MHQCVVLFGGTFNPIHFGHLISSRSAAETLGADRVILIPALRPPHKTEADLVAPELRLEMTRLAVAGDPMFEVSDIEIRRGGTSYTVDTVGHVRGEVGPNVELVWLIGADTLGELASWHRTEDLVRMCRVVTLRRPGWEAPDLGALRTRLGDAAVARLLGDAIDSDRIGISGTDIRRRLRAGRTVRYLVPAAVEEFILEKGVYGASDPSDHAK